MLRQASDSTTVEVLIARHSVLFKDELGTVTIFHEKFLVKTDALPQFCNPRPVPFTIKSAIEAELEQLESASIISKVAQCELATPIVPVHKKDGRFRICGDYKVTVNQALNLTGTVKFVY